jgi:hypothetical protein
MGPPGTKVSPRDTRQEGQLVAPCSCGFLHWSRIRALPLLQSMADPFRIRYTAGGDRIDYPGITTTPGAEPTTVNLHLNSVISTANARMM